MNSITLFLNQFLIIEVNGKFAAVMHFLIYGVS